MVLTILRACSAMSLCTSSTFLEASITWNIIRLWVNRKQQIHFCSLLASYLPVDCGISHQKMEFLLNCSLERTNLISFCTKLTSERSLSRTELQKHDEVRLWQARIRLLAPLQTETLKWHLRFHVVFLPQKKKGTNFKWLNKDSLVWHWWRQLRKRHICQPPNWCLAPVFSLLKVCKEDCH